MKSYRNSGLTVIPYWFHVFNLIGFAQQVQKLWEWEFYLRGISYKMFWTHGGENI